MQPERQLRKISPLVGETISPAPIGVARDKICVPKRPSTASGGPRLTEETQVLLRVRLRAAAIILLVGFSVFLVRHVVGVFLGDPFYPGLLGAHFGCTGIGLVFFALLSRVSSINAPSSISRTGNFRPPDYLLRVVTTPSRIDRRRSRLPVTADGILAAAHLYVWDVHSKHLAAHRGILARLQLHRWHS